jgi:hypothetical protein
MRCDPQSNFSGLTDSNNIRLIKKLESIVVSRKEEEERATQGREQGRGNFRAVNIFWVG